MRTFIKTILGVGIVAAVGAISVGPSAAQYYSGPGVGIYVGPTHHRHYRRAYVPRRHYGYRHQRRYGYNGCRYGFTVQDGVCKPYRGY